jgi:hypothetical protein
MWIMTPHGYFSIVEKPDDVGRGTLTIRARAKVDLDNLRSSLLPSLSAIQSISGADYPFRAIAGRADIGRALAHFVAEDLCYPNFNSQVEKLQGPGRADAYRKAWVALLALEREL